MNKAELMDFIGKNVTVYFKGGGWIYGTLKFADTFSEKHDCRKPNYFYIGYISFKPSRIRKVDRM